MVLCRQHLKIVAVFGEDPLEFFRHGQGKEAGNQACAVVSHRQMGSSAAEPKGVFVFRGGTADRLLGNIQTGQFCLHRRRQLGRVVAFAAADVQHGTFGTQFQRGLAKGFGNGGIKTGFQKGSPGEHLFPGVAGMQGFLLLNG